MEADTQKIVKVVDQTSPTGEDGSDVAYVSPEILAAQNGERVEMGMTIVVEESTQNEE